MSSLRTLGTLLKRELTSMALLAQTYAIAVAFIIISGVFFIDLVSSNNSADLASYYANIANTLIVLCPILAARSLAEERNSGQLMISLAWPVPRWALILSKFLANTLYTWLLISIAWIYYVQLNAFANPDLARVFGGWLGMLLLAAMFNALTLAISSRASTAASGAFMGFGVLLFFWVIQFLPSSIRGYLDDFGPLQHLNPMLRGIIYYADVVYFIVLSVGSLLLAIFAISRQRAGSDRSLQLRRAASVGGAVAVFLATPVAAGAVDGQQDLTPQKRETLSVASQEVLKKIGDIPIKITAFGSEVSQEASEVRNVDRKYSAFGANITHEIIDPDVSPARAQATGIVDYNTYRLEVGDGDSAQVKEIDDLIESTITSNIALMSKEDPPIVCFTRGHGERRLDDAAAEGLTSFAARLRIIGYEPAQILLEAKGADQLLEECAAVVMMGPRTQLPDEEIATLREYGENKGRLVIAADAVRGTDVKQLNAIIDPFGLKFLDNPVRDPQSLADDPAAIVSSRYPTANRIVDVLSFDDTPVVFANSLAVDRTVPENNPDGPQVTPLVQSSAESYLVEEAGSTERVDDSQAAYTLAALSTIGELTGAGTEATLASTRIGVIGSAEVASNGYQKTFGNQEFVIRLIQFVAADDDIVSAFREPGENSQFNITGPQRTTLIRQTVVLPSLAALVFVPFVLWRLKRG